MNPYDFFSASCARHPDRTALSDDSGSLTFAQTQQRVEALAGLLYEPNADRPLRIGVLAPNAMSAMVAILAVFRASAVWVPINSRNSTVQNLEYLQRCEVDILVVHHEYAEFGRSAKNVLPNLRKILTISAEAPEPGAAPAPLRQPDPGRLCAMLSTGGTTGLPKAVMWTERVVETMIGSYWLHLPCEDPVRYLAATPLTHAAGVIALCVLAGGGTVRILGGAKPEDVMREIQDQGITHLFLPPTVIYMMLAHPDVRRYSYKSLRHFIYSAAPMAPDKVREALETFGPVMVQLYGQAEVPLMGTILTAREHAQALASGDHGQLASCGRATLLTQLAILDDNDRPVPSGTPGEIAFRGSLVMQGYFGFPDETARVSRGGWHHTGDIGYMDGEGYVYIVDRKKDMIVTGGFNVFPTEVERVILQDPSVQDCAVIGVPDPVWGERVTAIVEPRPGADIDTAGLLAKCREALGGVKTPKEVIVRAELPRSPVGKVLKRELREEFWVGQARRV